MGYMVIMVVGGKMDGRILVGDDGGNSFDPETLVMQSVLHDCKYLPLSRVHEDVRDAAVVAAYLASEQRELGLSPGGVVALARRKLGPAGTSLSTLADQLRSN